MTTDLETCPGCIAAPGTPHGEDCDHACCPDCGEQLLFHDDCEYWPDDADGPDRPAIWHGINPQAEVARKLNWWTLHAPTGRRVEDYTRVTIAEMCGQVTWDRQAQRYVIGRIDETAFDRAVADSGGPRYS